MKHRTHALYIVLVMTMAALAFGPTLLAQSEQSIWRIAEQDENRIVLQRDAVIVDPTETVEPEPTATSEPAPTATVEPDPTATVTIEPTPTHDHGGGDITLGWHPPGAHDGINGHEHGDEPPQFVYDSPNQPFTQDRESHTGYKGVYAVSPGGVESYLITHIVSTAGARSHGDHDYQLWIRDPDTGEVFYADGVLDFGNPPPLRERDTGERPIILSVGDGNCETWYSKPGALAIDLGWTICGRYEKFDGTISGGNGTFRTMDWVLPCSRLPANHSLRNNCRTEFGVSRISWLVNSKDYNHPAVEPIN